VIFCGLKLCLVTFWWQSCACNCSMFYTCTRSGLPHNVVHSHSEIHFIAKWLYKHTNVENGAPKETIVTVWSAFWDVEVVKKWWVSCTAQCKNPAALCKNCCKKFKQYWASPSEDRNQYWMLGDFLVWYVRDGFSRYYRYVKGTLLKRLISLEIFFGL